MRLGRARGAGGAVSATAGTAPVAGWGTTRLPTSLARLGSLGGVAVAALVLLAPRPAPAVEAALLRGTCRAHFSGTSTLHDFTGTAPEVRFVVRRLPAGARWTAVVDVPVDALDTGSTRRDAKMRDMLAAARFPVLRASFDAIDAAAARPAASAAGELPFTLTIRDVARPMVGQVRHWREEAGRLSFEVAFAVSLSAFALRAPSALGVIRVGDEVRVRVAVVLEADEAAGRRS